MDMYQKREKRKKDKAEENNTEIVNKTNINWLMETYGSTHSNPCKISIFQN